MTAVERCTQCGQPLRGLTRHRASILRELAEGITAREIAAALGVTPAALGRAVRRWGHQVPRYRKYSAAEQAEVLVLLRAGRSITSTAAAVGMSRDTVARIARDARLEVRRHRQRSQVEQPEVAGRLRALVAAGLPDPAIASRLGVAPVTVYGWRHRLGLHKPARHGYRTLGQARRVFARRAQQAAKVAATHA